MKRKRKEFPIKNNPGIYKEMYWVDETSSWKATGKYRAIRRTVIDNESKKEQAVFDNIEDAKAFRNQEMEKRDSYSGVHKNDLHADGSMSFEELVRQWKVVHYLTVEESSQQTYEKLLPALDFLKKYRASEIDSDVIMKLAIYWKTEFPRTWRRKSFIKEWQLLSVILRFYKEEVRDGRNYPFPSFRKARKMTVLTPDIEGEVRYLTGEETTEFLAELKKEKNPFYYYLALTQYFFALRICEAAALCRDVVDFDRKVVTIKRSMTWEARTWIPKMKQYTKTKRVRYLPIPDMLVPELESLMKLGDQKNPLLFQKPDGSPVCRKTIAVVYNRVLKRLGYTHVSGTHFLRKTSATLANEATGDYDGVSKFLGHSSIRVTKRYVGETDSQKKKISQALDHVLRRKDDGPVPQYPAPGSGQLISLVKSGS